MKILSDLHMHICVTSWQEMLEEAINNELKFIGISEHVYQLHETRDSMGDFFLEGELFGMDEYFQVFRAIQDDGQEILRGVEVDYLPKVVPELLVILEEYPFDYVIGAVHELNGWDIHNLKDKPELSAEKLWMKYMDTQIEFLDQVEMQILAHPIRLAVTEKRVPASIKEKLEELVSKAKEKDVAIEINAKDIQLNPVLARMLLDFSNIQGSMITLGTDAHHPEEIRRGVTVLNDFLKGDERDRVVIFRDKVAIYV